MVKRVVSDEGSHITLIPPSLLYRAAVFAGACALFLAAGITGHGITSYVFGAIAGLLALRTIVIHMVVSPDGIRIVNPFRFYRLSWESLEDVTYEQRPFAWIGRGIGAKRHRVILKAKEGTEISIAASRQ